MAIQNAYEKFGFIRRRHDADKIGQSANGWKGSIVFSSEADDIQEIEAARNFESMVIVGAIPMHGNSWRLSGINFNFNPTPADKEELGAGVKCIVTLNYTSLVNWLTGVEVQERLNALGFVPAESIPDQPF